MANLTAIATIKQQNSAIEHGIKKMTTAKKNCIKYGRHLILTSLGHKKYVFVDLSNATISKEEFMLFLAGIGYKPYIDDKGRHSRGEVVFSTKIRYSLKPFIVNVVEDTLSLFGREISFESTQLLEDRLSKNKLIRALFMEEDRHGYNPSDEEVYGIIKSCLFIGEELIEEQSCFGIAN